MFGASALYCLARVGPGWLAGGLSLVLTALAVRINGGTMTGLDISVQTWLAAHRSRSWQADAGAIFGYLGQPLHFAVAVVFCGTLLSLHARSAMRLVVLLGAAGAGLVLEQTLKAAIGRTAQPLLHWSHAFPSGHVTMWAAFLGTVAVCLGIGRSRTTRLALGVLAAEGVVFVAFLAVYCGAHTVSDAIGGMVLGSALVAAGASIVTASPRVGLSRAVDSATPMSAHTTPMRTDDLLFGRAYHPPARPRYSPSTGRSGW